MTIRKIIKIDEDRCDGCGQCASACHEGAIQIIDGKAKLVSETYCDGLGACIGECPQDAITLEEREAEDFSQEAVDKHLHDRKPSTHSNHSHKCPSANAFEVTTSSSKLTNWPVQISLVPPNAPYLNDANLLICADCVPFAYANFHQDLLDDKLVLIGCPKLDDALFYQDKLADIFKLNGIKEITVAHMEVPCCFGLTQIVRDAIKQSDKEIGLEVINISIKGERVS
ncbi:MAG: 4Fe-4S dicluster domain-containing protein [Actinobacteria bacterium]|nr:MAG: 4Fe-4S dicluster domain-containing protein [Actinomycetota bacterium]